jgi:hypothetical protein
MIAAIVVAAGVTSACTADGNALPSPEPSDASLAQTFSRSQDASDSPTHEFIAAHTELLWTTSRALLIEDEAQWWVVRTEQDEWCIIGSLPQGELAASTLLCAPDAEFQESGVRSFVGDETGERSDIWLVPDGFPVSEQDGESWRSVTPNVLVPAA